MEWRFKRIWNAGGCCNYPGIFLFYFSSQFGHMCNIKWAKYIVTAANAVTHSEERAVYPLLHTLAPRGPWLACADRQYSIPSYTDDRLQLFCCTACFLGKKIKIQNCCICICITVYKSDISISHFGTVIVIFIISV